MVSNLWLPCLPTVKMSELSDIIETMKKKTDAASNETGRRQLGCNHGMVARCSNQILSKEEACYEERVY